MGLPYGASMLAVGDRGAVAAAHPLAAGAAARILEVGGSAADAAVAAQAVICVVMPQAAGLGGDLLALVHDHGAVHAVNGTGLSPRSLAFRANSTGGASVTVPGLVDGWLTLHRRWGRLPLTSVLAAATDLARAGVDIDDSLLAAVRAQLPRLVAGGAAEWGLARRAVGGGKASGWTQPHLAQLLEGIAERGRDAFYAGPPAAAIAAAVQRHGGVMEREDLAEHLTPCPSPVVVPWASGRAAVQPPASQGVLLAMALHKVKALAQAGRTVTDHILVEVTGAAFAYRSQCGRGRDLLGVGLDVDPDRASGRAGPRAYLHTAGVATADSRGQVVSSLVSVFDDFGSGVFVPELGIVLSNRAAGFTDGDNAPRPAARPVHTLAPALLTGPDGAVALATPGADGQVQTLLQVLARTALSGAPLTAAVDALRWRSQDGKLLVEQGHPGADELTARGHGVVPTPPGSGVFGAVVAAGFGPAPGKAPSAKPSRPWSPYAVADWRRQTSAKGVG